MNEARQAQSQHMLAGIFFVVVGAVLLFPLWGVFGSAFIGDAFSDAYEYARHIWWMNHALQNGQPIFDQPLLAYPDGLGGAWLWGNPLQSFPAWLLLFVMPLPAAYNLGALLHLALNGWSLYLLAWRLVRSWLAALLAGAVFMLYPAAQGHLIASHTGLLVLWGVPLALLALLRLQEHTRPRDVLLAAVALLASILGNNLLLVYLLFPLITALVLMIVARREWAWLRRVMAAGVLGGLAVAAFVLPVALEQLSSPLPPPGGDVQYSADALAVVAPSFYNPLFSDLTYSRRILGGVNNVEGTAYLGLLPALLALLALWSNRRARWWGWAALGAWVLSLGPLLKAGGEVVTVSVGGLMSHIVLPWALLSQLPVLNIARTAARFNLAVGLALAVLVAFGWAWLMNRVGARPVRLMLTGVVLLLVAFEYQVMWQGNRPHLHTTPYPQPEAVRALRDDPSVEAVLNLPYDHLLAAKTGMILQTLHHKPLVAGHVTRQTPVNPAKLATLQHTLNPALLDAAGADVIMLHRRWDFEHDIGPVEQRIVNALGAPAYTDDALMMWVAPPAEGEPGFVGVPHQDTTTDRAAASYAYAPAPGWVTFQGIVDGAAQLRLDGQVVHEVTGDFTARLPLGTGYHTVTLAVPQPCPDAPDPALRCPRLGIRDLTFTEWANATTPNPVRFGEVAILQAYEITPEAVHLSWHFPEPLPENAVRFVHLLDSDGNPALQQDSPPTGPIESIALGGLAPGTYTVYSGWYTLPGVTRLPVQPPGTPGAASGWAQLGEVQVE